MELLCCRDIINKTSWKMMEKASKNREPEKMSTFECKEFPFLARSGCAKLLSILYQYKSKLQIQIVRTPLLTQSKQTTFTNYSDSYSYGVKSFFCTKYLADPPVDYQKDQVSKKVKREVILKSRAPRQCTLKIEELPECLDRQQTDLSKQFWHQKTGIKSHNTLKFAIIEDGQKSAKKNPMLKSEIDIISNDNQKLKVFIHQGLLASNTSHPKIDSLDNFQHLVPNFYDTDRRDYYLNKINFQKEYKSGYAPIEMQLRNSDSPEDLYSSKNHVIKKKQSTLSLPRSCGVSYIKESESRQGSPYSPLPALIFQCSSICSDRNQLKEKFDGIISEYISFMTLGCLPFIKCEESEMRRLLLGEKIGEVGWVTGIQNLWPCYVEGLFFLVLISEQECHTEQQIWSCFSRAIFKIGILVKKSTSGKKAFLKSIGLEHLSCKQEVKTEQNLEDKNLQRQQHDRLEENTTQKEEERKEIYNLHKSIIEELKDARTANTLSLRLETYIEKQQWAKLDKDSRDMLYFLTTGLKEHLEKQSLEIIDKRIKISKSDDKQRLLQALQHIRKSSALQVSSTRFMIKPTFDVNSFSVRDLLGKKMQKAGHTQMKINACYQSYQIEDIARNSRGESTWDKFFKIPLYYISTRDSFAFDLIEKVTYIQSGGRRYKQIKYYFDRDNLPTNYGTEYQTRFPEFDVGITCYHDFFTDEEMKQFELNTFATEQNAFKNKFLQMTVQPSIATGKIKRTKFFFGYRYVWTRCQLAEPGAFIGAGVRKDVTPPPRWTKNIVNAFVENKIADKDFINSIAINVYHDGKQGLAQHFDDAVRFKQPIYTLRLFSDARLSFGSQFYGFCNGAFIIPLPRGCICVMQENSYAANGVKHCVRPCDMAGKSAAVILRQMHQQVIQQAARFDEYIQFPCWFSTISDKDGAITFAEQKRRESEYLIDRNKYKLQKK